MLGSRYAGGLEGGGWESRAGARWEVGRRWEEGGMVLMGVPSWCVDQMMEKFKSTWVVAVVWLSRDLDPIAMSSGWVFTVYTIGLEYIWSDGYSL
jgi:hypothetical protein